MNLKKRRKEASHKCHICKKPRHYNQEFDAYYCESCNLWLEPKCSQEGSCDYCASRPRNPIVARLVK